MKFKSEFIRALISALVAFLTALGASSCLFDNKLTYEYAETESVVD